MEFPRARKLELREFRRKKEREREIDWQINEFAWSPIEWKSFGEVWRASKSIGYWIDDNFRGIRSSLRSLWIGGETVFSSWGWNGASNGSNDGVNISWRQSFSTWMNRTGYAPAFLRSIDAQYPRNIVYAEFRVIPAAVNTSGVCVHVRKIYINAKLIWGGS